MKKLLITGFNKNQCTREYFRSQQLKVVPSHYSLFNCLEDMNYDVEQRPVVVGEEKIDYDDVIIFIHSPNSFCQNLYGGLWAIHQYPNAIIAFDDWQIDQIIKGFEKMHRDLNSTEEENKAFRDYLLDQQMLKNSVEDLKKYKQIFKQSVEHVLNNKSRVLISAFAGGDLSSIKINSDNVFRYNPNPYHYNRTPENNFRSEKRSLFGDDFVNPQDKTREWNFASLVQNKTKKWLERQNAAWKVNFYGQLKGENKNLRLTEDEMCRVFHTQWGCLMPGYFHDNSGWWRARPLQVADAGSILIGSYNELMILYKDTNLSSLTCSDVENMSLHDLTITAQRQKEALYDIHPLDKKVQRNELQEVLDNK